MSIDPERLIKKMFVVVLDIRHRGRATLSHQYLYSNIPETAIFTAYIAFFSRKMMQRGITSLSELITSICHVVTGGRPSEIKKSAYITDLPHYSMCSKEQRQGQKREISNLNFYSLLA